MTGKKPALFHALICLFATSLTLLVPAHAEVRLQNLSTRGYIGNGDEVLI